MQLATFTYNLSQRAWSVSSLPALDSPRTLVVAFGAPELVGDPEVFRTLRQAYPRSHVIGCSSAGEIAGTEVRDGTLSVAAAQFAHTDLASAAVLVRTATSSYDAGRVLAQKLQRPGLRALLVLSEGLKINGSELVRGINSVVDDSVVVTGGLAGDGTRFERTWVCCGNRLQSGLVAGVGLYGDRLIVGHGSKGGWDKFGPERRVTRSEGNVLFELDGEPALDLYKRYLGDKAAGLPATGLLFPLALRCAVDSEVFLVRTVLAVDGDARSLTFAGDVPEGWCAQLMKADFERLIGGAEGAALMARDIAREFEGNTLNIAISCVGRRLVLGDRIDEELEAVQGVLPPGTRTTGFYSYGEISPYATGHCDLHNQTMTLTVLGESARGTVRESRESAREPAREPARAVARAPRTTAPYGARPPAQATPPSPPSRPARAPAPPPAQATEPERTGGIDVATVRYDLDRKQWSQAVLPALDSMRTLVLVFGAPEAVDHPEVFEEIARRYPRSQILGCSSAGEIAGTEVHDRSLAIAIARFRHTRLIGTAVIVADAAGSYRAGQSIAQRLNRPDLRAVLLLSEGLDINGSELVRGINEQIDPSVVVTGGLAGDGTRFAKTWVFCGDRLRNGVVGAVGFYGDHLVVGHGSKGGWDNFGPERIVTRAEANVLYELDGKPALALYKQYLGDKAAQLPASALLFPLALRARADDDRFLVRTVLSVDDAAQSMTFAGDVPTGWRARLMKADFERLIGGAEDAALMAKTIAAEIGGAGDRTGEGDEGEMASGLNVAISCVGRRIVLGDRTDEELEAVRDVLPPGTATVGFYSYGEISPYASGHCDLHNQTMTLTYLSEAPAAIATAARQSARTAAVRAMLSESRTSSYDRNPALPPAAAAATPAVANPAASAARAAPRPVPAQPARAVVVPGTSPASMPAAGVRGGNGHPSAVPFSPPAAAPGGASPFDRAPSAAHSAEPATFPAGALADEPRSGARQASAPGRTPAASSAFAIATFRYDLDEQRFSVSRLPAIDSPRTLILVFGAPEFADHVAAFRELRQAYPQAHIVGCSSAGEIADIEVRDRSLSIAAVRFEHTALSTTAVKVGDAAGSFSAGQVLAHKLRRPDLRAILVLSEGLKINGSELVRGINDVVDPSVVVTGGLAGDGVRFERTWTLVGDKLQDGLVVAVGLYGDHLIIGHGSQGGWDRFGRERVITRSQANVLYELDGKPALALYKQYLGDKAAGLPATGLLFPLALRASADDDKVLVRTVLAIDEAEGTMTFAGDLPEGGRVQLMKADFERLIGGAEDAAHMALELSSDPPTLEAAGEGAPCALNIAISCVGRRIVLGDRTEEELEAVRNALPRGTETVGFYSYGEISPYATGHCDLHNQTMTLTVLSESRTPLPRRDALEARSPQPMAARAPMPRATPRTPMPAATPHATPTARMSAGESARMSAVPRVERHGSEASGAVRELSGAIRAGSDLHVLRRDVGDVAVLALSGRINESFLGRELARSLAGTVVLDLAGIDRVTSYGVREWLHMLADAEPHIDALYLARCSEPIVNQLIMIRALAGGGHIVSFDAPYVCSACSHAFCRLIDCEEDAVAIREGAAPDAACPRCDSPAFFDDDARSYFGFAAPYAGRPLPKPVRDAISEASALSQVSAASLEAVEKTVEGERTIIRINGELDESLRWFRILDGVEGVLRVDLEGVTAATEGGMTTFGVALQSIQTEVDRIELERCPTELARYLSEMPATGLFVQSAFVPATCPRCELTRAVLVDIEGQRESLAAGTAPNAICKRCNRPLSFADAADMLVRLGRRGHKPARDRVQTQPMPAQEPASPSTPSRLPWVLGLGVVVGVALVGAVWLGMRVSSDQTSANDAPPGASRVVTPAPPTDDHGAASISSGSELPPAWADRAFVVDGGDVFVVGRSDPTPEPGSALEAASRDAIRVILERVAGELEGSRLYDLLRQRAEARAASGGPADQGAFAGAPAAEIARAVRHYQKQVGEFASPKRVDTHLAKTDAGTVAIVRYRLATEALSRAIAYYKSEAIAIGFVVVPRFPALYDLSNAGDLVVGHVEPGSYAERIGVAVGDVIIKVAGRYVSSIDEYDKLIQEAWRTTDSGGSMELEVAGDAGRRTIAFRKLRGAPRPTGPRPADPDPAPAPSN